MGAVNPSVAVYATTANAPLFVLGLRSGRLVAEEPYIIVAVNGNFRPTAVDGTGKVNVITIAAPGASRVAADEPVMQTVPVLLQPLTTTSTYMLTVDGLVTFALNV